MPWGYFESWPLVRRTKPAAADLAHRNYININDYDAARKNRETSHFAPPACPFTGEVKQRRRAQATGVLRAKEAHTDLAARGTAG
jgi:hypothetical protein